MWRQQFLLKFALFYHEFEIDVDVLAALSVQNFSFFFLPLGLLHLEATFLSVFLYFFDLLKMCSLFLSSSHFLKI